MTCEDRQPKKTPWSLGTQTQAHDIKSMQLYTWRIQSVKHSINRNCTVLSGDGKSFTSCQAWGVCGYNTQVIIFRKKCRALVGQHHSLCAKVQNGTKTQHVSNRRYLLLFWFWNHVFNHRKQTQTSQQKTAGLTSVVEKEKRYFVATFSLVCVSKTLKEKAYLTEPNVQAFWLFLANCFYLVFMSGLLLSVALASAKVNIWGN